jgi:flagellar hook-basal body complex protein FliE
MEPSSLGAMRQYQVARQALSPDTNKPGSGATKTAVAADGSGFADSMKAFSEVFENVETTTQAMASGKADAHSVVQAMAQAEVALETAVTIRNRVVEAYQELLRMPV